MNRPKPCQIQWEKKERGTYRQPILHSKPLDEHFYIRKGFCIPDFYTYEVVDTRANGFPVVSEPSASELLKTLYRQEGSALLRTMPETCAALASITSNEDWENLDA